MNVVLLHVSATSFVELCNLYYCATRVVTDECGILTRSKASSVQQTAPPWEICLRTKLQKFRKDLSWLHEFDAGKLSQSKSSKLDRVYNLSHCSVDIACEEVRQSIKAVAH